MKQKTLIILVLFFLVSCVDPIPFSPPTQTIVPTPTATTTLTITPTRTEKPTSSPTSIPTKTLTPTPTVTITASPKVEAIRQLVGDQPEDWFKWRDDVGGIEVKFIFPGLESISTLPFDLMDGEGKFVEHHSLPLKLSI